MPKIGTATLAVSRVRPCARLRGQGPGDLLLLKSKQEAQDDLDRHASLDHTPFDPAVRTTESYLKEVRIQMRLSGRRGANLTLLQHGVTVMRRSVRMRKCCRMLSGSLIGNRCSFWGHVSRDGCRERRRPSTQREVVAEGECRHDCTLTPLFFSFVLAVISHMCVQHLSRTHRRTPRWLKVTARQHDSTWVTPKFSHVADREIVRDVKYFALDYDAVPKRTAELQEVSYIVPLPSAVFSCGASSALKSVWFTTILLSHRCVKVWPLPSRERSVTVSAYSSSSSSRTISKSANPGDGR